MKYEEFQRHIGKAGLTIKAFAELLAMNRISISNLSRKGDVPVHLAVIAALMGEMADNGLDFRPVLARLRIQPRQARGEAAHGIFAGKKDSGSVVQVSEVVGGRENGNN